MSRHRFQKFLRTIPLLVLMLAFALVTPFSSVQAAAITGDNTVVLTSPMLQAKEPITVYLALGFDMHTLDPQVADDSTSISPVENLFLGLTDVDPKTQEIRPEVATSWKKNAAGDVWTFELRNDVPWVRYDPATKQAEEVGKVTAQDFEYGIKRACDPRLGAYYGKVTAAIIKGCAAVNSMNPADFKEADFDQIQVKALSDTQLEVTLTGDLPYFEYASPMWMLRASPRATIEQYGPDWIEPGNIVTNGWWMLDTWEKNVHRVFVKNPLLPADFQDNYGGNVERIDYTYVRDTGTVYAKFQNNEVDATGIPLGEQAKIMADPELSKNVVRSFDLTVTYYGFAFDKPPFNNVHARRAFSAMIDRKGIVADLLGGRGAPMAHFMPPGIFGSVGINEVGVGNPENLGFDPEYAKKEFAAAGYPNCENFPTITIITEASEWAEIIQNQAKTHLGCDPSKITIQQAEFQVKQESIKADVPTAQRPNLWVSVWGPDYLDAQNWMYDVLSCKTQNDYMRPCDANDEKIEAASKELDSDKRAQMYREIEEQFFGPDGLFPIAPIYTSMSLTLFKPWYKGLFDSDALLGGVHWETRFIDQEAQLAARPAQ